MWKASLHIKMSSEENVMLKCDMVTVCCFHFLHRHTHLQAACVLQKFQCQIIIIQVKNWKP